MNGIPLETVSKMLRHKYTTTTQIYAKVTNQMIGNAISRIEDKIGDRFQFSTLKERATANPKDNGDYKFPAESN